MAGRYFKYIFTIFALLCVSIVVDHVFHLGMGTSKLLDPNVQKNPLKLIEPILTTQPVSGQVPRSIATPATVTAEPPKVLQKRYVKIEGQYFEYNPSNVYKVRGVSTFYVSGGKGAENDAIAGADMAHKATAAALRPAGSKPATNLGDKSAKVADMVHKNPMGVYSAEGVQATIDGARDAAEQIKQRDQVLKELENADK